MYGENLDQNPGANPGTGGYFGFMQIKTFKLSHMKPCANKRSLGSNILDIQSAYKSIIKDMFG